MGIRKLRHDHADTLTAESQRTYRASFLEFAEYLTEERSDNGILKALARLIGGGYREAKGMLLGFQNNQFDIRGLAAHTVNGRVACLQSFISYAEDCGAIDWVARIKPIPTEPVQLLTLTRRMLQSVIRTAENRCDPKGCRDALAIRLFHDLQLRRKVVLALDVSDYDVQSQRLLVANEWVKLPPKTAAAFLRWMKVRGDTDGALILSCANINRGNRMKGNGLWGAMTRLGGKECNPDNIRKLGAKIKARPDESEDDLRIRRSKAL